MLGYEEIFDELVTGLLEKAKAEMSESDPKVRQAKETLAAASQRIVDSPSFDAQTKATIDEYFAAMQLLADEEHRHLYLQGAKDFALLLREFGIIK